MTISNSLMLCVGVNVKKLFLTKWQGKDTIPNASFAYEFCYNRVEEKSHKKGKERVIIPCFVCMLDIPKLHQHGNLKHSVDTADIVDAKVRWV